MHGFINGYRPNAEIGGVPDENDVPERVEEITNQQQCWKMVVFYNETFGIVQGDDTKRMRFKIMAFMNGTEQQ